MYGVRWQEAALFAKILQSAGKSYRSVAIIVLIYCMIGYCGDTSADSSGTQGNSKKVHQGFEVMDYNERIKL